MQFRSRLVLCALAVGVFASWLIAEGVQKSDLPGALKEIREGVQHLSQEVKMLQSAVKELASASKHATTIPAKSILSRSSKSDLERSREAYDRGRESEKLKLCPAAIEAFTESVLIDPMNESAFLHRGSCYAELGQFENALSDLNQTILLQPDNSRAYGTRAAIEARIGQTQKALADINQALDRDPSYSEAHLLRGELFQSGGETFGAIGEFSAAISVAPDSEKTYLKRAELYRTTGQLDLALADCNQAIRISPQSAAGFLCRAECYLKKGAADLAITDLNRAESAQDSSAIRLIVSSAREIVNEQQSVRRAEQEKLEPAATLAASTAGPRSDEAKQPTQPAQEKPIAPAPPPATPPSELSHATPIPFSKAAAPRPDPTKGVVLPKSEASFPLREAKEYDRRGRQSAVSGNLDEALQALAHAIELDPKLASAYNARGYVYLRLRQPQRALADFNEAIRLNSSYPNAYHNRAVARRLLGDSAGMLEDEKSADEIIRRFARRLPSAASSNQPRY